MPPRGGDYKPISSLGFKYPSRRDNGLHTPDIWLEGKRADDDLDGFWRVHDNIYDFSKFINHLPGGADWLELTKGTDITEAFEAHHISMHPGQILSKFLLRKASQPRNSPFTFKESGFYKTLKRRIVKELDNVPQRPAHASKIMADLLLAGFLAFAFLATLNNNYWLGLVSATFLTFVSIAAHNFFHQKNNFRMYYFDLTLMSSRGWRVSHVLSHHIYTNTVYDLEISSLEPLLQFMPTKKNFITRYISWFYFPLILSLLYIGSFIRITIHTIKERKTLRKENFIPLVLLLLLYLVTGQPFLLILRMFIWIEVMGSLIFGIVSLNGVHHHPNIFHDGDAARPREELDWGIHQLDTVIDRTEVTGSHFWVLVTFGDHGLHHLFPTIDHGRLIYLYPIFEQTCKEFGVEFRTKSSWKLAAGMFRQLAKTESNKNPPKKCIVK